MCFQQRVLDDIGRAGPGLKLLIELRPSDQFQIVEVQLQELP